MFYSGESRNQIGSTIQEVGLVGVFYEVLIYPDCLGR